jgi:hypothetical protein
MHYGMLKNRSVRISTSDDGSVISVVVLNYIDRKSTVRCARSVISSSWENTQVIVVDNSSDNVLKKELDSYR